MVPRRIGTVAQFTEHRRVLPAVLDRTYTDCRCARKRLGADGYLALRHEGARRGRAGAAGSRERESPPFKNSVDGRYSDQLPAYMADANSSSQRIEI